MTLTPTVVPTARGPIEFAEFGDGPPVLLLHGSMGGWQQGELLARTLDLTGYRIILVSRPGYMQTPLDSGRSAAAQADLYAALLDSNCHSLVLRDPPASQDMPSRPDGRGPAIEMLNCLRTTDLYQLPALLVPARIQFQGLVPDTYQWSVKTMKNLEKEQLISFNN